MLLCVCVCVCIIGCKSSAGTQWKKPECNIAILAKVMAKRLKTENKTSFVKIAVFKIAILRNKTIMLYTVGCGISPGIQWKNPVCNIFILAKVMVKTKSKPKIQVPYAGVSNIQPVDLHNESTNFVEGGVKRLWPQMQNDLATPLEG